ncbi:MAG: ice-binding family protein, partial [Candidatus Saccharibacteria bacterium]|nr:ice-binding family protein [Candidatus Saccharibacteria bacterium]
MNKIKLLALPLVISILLVFVPLSKAHAATSPDLGNADGFAVIAGTTITATGTSVITGNVGLEPGAGSAIEPTCTEVDGTIYDRDGNYVGDGDQSCRVTNASLLGLAKTDLGTAYDNLSLGDNATCTVTYPGTQDLVGLTLVPGVYCADAFALSGTLTLSGTGVWVFRSAATLVTSGTANIVGGNACSIWWKVVSSATLGTNTSLKGNILALTSITMATGATLEGQALARNGAVTLDSNTITKSTCTATLRNPDSSAASEDSNTFNEDTRCLATTPLVPQWASRSSANGGVNLLWSAVGGSKVDIEITNNKGEYEYKYVKVP